MLSLSLSFSLSLFPCLLSRCSSLTFVLFLRLPVSHCPCKALLNVQDSAAQAVVLATGPSLLKGAATFKSGAIGFSRGTEFVAVAASDGKVWCVHLSRVLAGVSRE